MKRKIIAAVIISLIPLLAWSQGKVTVPKRQHPAKKENLKSTKSKSSTETKTQPKIEYEDLDYSKRTAVLKYAKNVIGTMLSNIAEV